MAGSFAFTKGAAYFMNQPVNDYLADLVGYRAPKSRLMFKLFKCGKHVGTRCKFSGFNIYETEPGKIAPEKL